MIINGIYENTSEITITGNDYVIIDNWNYSVAVSDIFNNYAKNKKKYCYLKDLLTNMNSCLNYFIKLFKSFR